MEFDLTVKKLFQAANTRLFEHLAGAPALEWLNVEMPRVDLRKPDLIARMPNGRPFHLELNTKNEFMGRRMLEYYSRIWEADGQPPSQHLLFVGREAMSIEGIVRHEDLTYRFKVSDIRELNAEFLLESEVLEDNILAILCRIHDNREVVRRILWRISQAPPEKRSTALAEFLVLSDLRPLVKQVVAEEQKAMPIILDLKQNELLRPYIDKAEEDARERGLEQGLEQGREQGREQGLAEGRQQGDLAGRRSLVRRLLERRFRAIPAWAESQLMDAPAQALDIWADRVLDASSIDEVFRT